MFVLRQFRKSQIIQLALTFLYSVFIECTSWGLFFIQPEGLLQKISLAFLACVILSIGVAFTINSGFAVMPMEGLVKSIADKTHHSFGVIRVLLELSLTAGSAVVAFTFLHNLSPIGIGTVLTAFLSGNITNLFPFFSGKKCRPSWESDLQEGLFKADPSSPRFPPGCPLHKIPYAPASHSRIIPAGSPAYPRFLRLLCHCTFSSVCSADKSG